MIDLFIRGDERERERERERKRERERRGVLFLRVCWELFLGSQTVFPSVDRTTLLHPRLVHGMRKRGNNDTEWERERERG